MHLTQYNKSCKYAMYCHLSALIALVAPLFHLFIPLALWLFKKDESLFINDQGKEALNFQLSITLYMLIAGMALFSFLGSILGCAIILFSIVQVIIASIRTSKGDHYRYPFTIRFL